MYKEADKVIKVVKSCKSLDQLRTAQRFFNAWKKYYDVDGIGRLPDDSAFDLGVDIQKMIWSKMGLFS